MVESGGYTFRFNDYEVGNYNTSSAIQKGLHNLKGQQPRNTRKPASGLTAQLLVVILIASARSITTHDHIALSLEGFFFATETSEQAKLQPQLAGVTLSA
jgi:hypothetical protein